MRHIFILILTVLVISLHFPSHAWTQPTSAHKGKNVKIIAHRGASAIAPENTLAAFRKAVELGSDILELDVHQTRDSHLVVIHDGTVDRTTNGKGRVADYTAHELRQLDAGSWFALEFAGEQIPLLSEVFDSTPDSMTLLIELKYGSSTYPGIEERVIQLVREKKAERRVIVKSFEDDTLNRLRKLAPDIPRLKIIFMEIPIFGIIIERGLNVGTVLDASVLYIQHHWFWLTKNFIDKAHRRGYKVFAWDVHDEKRMREVIAKGVDGIETDFPDKLRLILIGK